MEEKKTIDAIEFLKKHKEKLLCLLVFFIAAVIAIVFLNNRHEEKINKQRQEVYNTAINYLRTGEPDEAKKLFSSLPPDYAITKYDLTASQWDTEIDENYNCEFLGTWSSSGYLFEITQRIDSMGVHIEYRKELRGGVLVYEGYLKISESDNKKAQLGSSKGDYHYESNAYKYDLVLANENTMDMYFEGEHHITLTKNNCKNI